MTKEKSPTASTGHSRRAARWMAFVGVLIAGVICVLAALHISCGSALPVAIAPPAATKPAVAQSPPRNLSPLREGTWTYDVIDGNGKGTTVTQIVSQAPTDVAAPWRRASSADNVIAHLRKEPDASVIMLANEIGDHDVINTFDPPLVVIPAPEKLGIPVSITANTITKLRSGLKMQVDHGTAELTLTPLGTETVQAPAGTFKCQVIELKLHLKFGLGEVQSSARLDYADGVGLVAESYSEKATTLFVTSNKTRKSVLKSYPH